MQATMLDFRRRMSEIQGAISRRERVTITSHGRPWAVIVAYEDAKPEVPSARDCAAAGMITAALPDRTSETISEKPVPFTRQAENSVYYAVFAKKGDLPCAVLRN